MKKKGKKTEMERNRGEVGQASLIHLTVSSTNESEATAVRENYLRTKLLPTFASRVPDPYATGTQT